MRKVIYSMSVSLDGFIADRDGNIDWSTPDEGLHRFHNERVRAIGTQLCGRRLYEIMRYWETVADDPSASEIELEFAGIWQAMPRLVFSRTLERAEGGAELMRDDIATVVARLKEQPGGDIAVGGASLAASLVTLGLVDEYQLFVVPIVLGAGTPFFPPLDARIGLRLIETRRFDSEVVYLRYEVSGPADDE
jgi:dihydrofolate reductase